VREVNVEVSWFACLMACAVGACAAAGSEPNRPQANGSAGLPAPLPIGGSSPGAGVAGGMAAPGGSGGESMPIAGMSSLPLAGTGGSAAESGGAGGMGGLGGMGGAGGVAATPLPSNSPDCPDGFKCQSLGTQSVCVAMSNSLPPACTMAGDPACGALAGSMCTMSTAGMQCVKPCTVAGAMPAGCPAGLMCLQSVVGTPFCGTTGALVAPACTIGGTECQQYSLQCVDVGFGPGCWTTCTL